MFSSTLCALRGTLSAARVMHNTLLHSVLRAPLRHFEVTPMGRILARFSSDIYTIDSVIPEKLKFWLRIFFRVCFKSKCVIVV